MSEKQKPTGLALMREPFEGSAISKLPKPTRAQTDKVKADFKQGIRCPVCNGWHHKDVVHLDYVGHAALTDRLLECDPAWNWEPLAFTEQGLPMVDNNGGMWIRLTVCGQSRLGYGDAEGKKGGNAVKELIGDALRNAAMRFGAALDLWHKGDLHGDEEPEVVAKPEPKNVKDHTPDRQQATDAEVKAASDAIAGKADAGMLKAYYLGLPKNVAADSRVIAAKDKRKGELA